MKVGIIVYSQTGNTLSVAQKLEQALNAAGHTAIIERVEPVNSDPHSPAPVQLKSAPDVSQYDAIIFASPVQAFSLAQVMKMYLAQTGNLSGKKVYCFVTQQLKHAWMGGNHAVRQIKALCKENGAEVIDSGIVNWSSDKRSEQIDGIVNQFTSSI